MTLVDPEPASSEPTPEPAPGAATNHSDDSSTTQGPTTSSPPVSEDVYLTDSVAESDIGEDISSPIPEPSPLTPRHDRYGWVVRDDRPMTEKEAKLVEMWERKEQDRATKWGKMFENFTKFRIYHRDVFERRVKKGIPDTWRARAWVWILDRVAEKEYREKKRQRRDVGFYFDKGVPDTDDVIRNDIPRTMPSHSLFSEDDTRERFYRILRAYANASQGPDFGYVQGMAFPAAMLIAYVPDDYEVFWAFMHMMNGERLGLAKMYQGRFDGLHKLNQVWGYIMKHRYRAVYDHLAEVCVQEIMYTPTYFLCAFMSCQFPTFLRLRIFDRFICCGFRALVSLALVFVKLNKKILSEGELEDVLPILKTPTCEDFSVLLKEWDKEWMSEDDFDKWCARAKVVLKKNPNRKSTL